MKKKTCRDCPWKEWDSGNKYGCYLSGDTVKSIYEECLFRRMVCIMRDEIRRLNDHIRQMESELTAPFTGV